MKFGKRSLFSVRGLMYMFYVIYIKWRVGRVF